MSKVSIGGKHYKVIEHLGYNHDIGKRVVQVETDDGPRMAVAGSPGMGYRFWTAEDRVVPLREAINRGWPNKMREE